MLLKISGIAAASASMLALMISSAAAQDDYGPDCHQQNAGVGTVLGAIAGGIIGNQFGHGGGRVAATVGGVVLGGVAGNAIASDVDCDDRPYAFRVYREGFEGPIGQRFDWRDDRNGHYGYIIPVREFQDGPYLCRDFREGVWRHDAWHERTGTACRQEDGEWHFR